MVKQDVTFSVLRGVYLLKAHVIKFMHTSIYNYTYKN